MEGKEQPDFLVYSVTAHGSVTKTSWLKQRVAYRLSGGRIGLDLDCFPELLLVPVEPGRGESTKADRRDGTSTGQ